MEHFFMISYLKEKNDDEVQYSMFNLPTRRV